MTALITTSTGKSCRPDMQKIKGITREEMEEEIVVIVQIMNEREGQILKEVGGSQEYCQRGGEEALGQQ